MSGVPEHTKIVPLRIEGKDEVSVYTIRRKKDDKTLTTIMFQEGPTKEYGVNGIFHEDLLLILIDRLKNFQETEFACIENDQQLELLEKTLEISRKRRERRMNEGSYGTSNPDIS